jgi:hypothetical protein
VKQITAAMAALLLATSAEAAGIRGELGFGYDSNVNNARQGGNDREDGFAQLSAGVHETWSLGQQHALQGRFDVESQKYLDWEGLDHAKGTASIRYLLRPGAGFYAPLLALTGSAAWWEFNSQIRDGAVYRGSFFALQQITTKISVRLTGGGDWRRARREEAFTLSTKSAGIDLDWMLTNHVAIYAGFQRRWGHFVTTRPTPPPASFVFAPDDAFPGEFATRQRGAANIATLGFNFALSPAFAIDVQGFYVEAAANTGVHYRRIQSIASLLARF